jgi:hypothetical protein
MKWVRVTILVRSPSYFQDGIFPTKKTALFPLRLEHFICLLLNLVPRDQRLSLLEEVDKVILDVLKVSLVFRAGLYISWHPLMFIKVLYPREVIISFELT